MRRFPLGLCWQAAGEVNWLELPASLEEVWTDPHGPAFRRAAAGEVTALVERSHGGEVSLCQ